MTSEPSYRGSCFCGAVEIEATGAPFAMGYCHCADCRAWAGAPVNGFTLWKPEAVKVNKGEALLATYRKTEKSHRQYCTECGGHLMTRHPDAGFVDVYAAVLPGLRFQPTLHVQYGETVLRITDGLPKFKDFPEQFGGSGETLAE